MWIDIFACRQWPSSHPDLDFEYTIPNRSSSLLIRRKVVSGQTYSLPKQIIDQIAFLRVWCLTEIDTAVKCKESKGMPIMMKRSSYKKIQGKDLFEFKHNIEMLKNMSYLLTLDKHMPPSPKIKRGFSKKSEVVKMELNIFSQLASMASPASFELLN